MSTKFVRRGFTLVELMIALGIAALLAVLAAPSLASLASGMRLTSAINAMVSSLLLARSEAIKRNTRAVICKSADGANCIKTGGWDQGWLVFQDTNNNAALDDGEPVVLRQAALAEGIRLTGNDPLANYISFTPWGLTQYKSGAFQAGTLTACPLSDGPVDAKTIVISASGRLRTAPATLDVCS